jgi:hypothetical protein
MTEHDLQQIRDRLAAASPGPWLHTPDAPQQVWGPGGPGHGVIAETCMAGLQPYPGGQQARDAAFIAHARQDVAALLDALDRHRAAAAAAARYLRSLRAGMPLLAERGADSAPFRAAADRSAAALRDFKDALAAAGWKLAEDRP